MRRPLTFLVDEELTREEERTVTKIEAIRTALIARGTEQVRYYPNVSPSSSGQDDPIPRPPKNRPPSTISWRRIATVSSVTPYWGAFLHLCAKAHGSRTILELGSCAGISSCFLASSPSCKRFMTVEGAPDLAAVATAHLATISPEATVITATFDDALDRLLPSLNDPLDFVFIDGHHEGPARLHYSRRVTPYLRPGSLLIWDDIQWSTDLWAAWQSFSRAMGVSCAINLGRFGLIIWGGHEAHNSYHDFSAFAGYWGKGRPKPER